MCGIAGTFTYSSTTPPAKETLSAMGDFLQHRGPDDTGTYLDTHVGLLHKRLSIIDLSSRGHEPMSNENGSIWLTFNGEIYNFLDIRKKLSSHTFRSNTDAEVIIHAYEEWGINSIQQFEGMFAFALWDANKKVLFLVRDRVGEKPLLYCHSNGSLIFASEIPAILAALPSTPSISPQGLHHYFTHSFYVAPHPYTIFEGIQKLPPAHYLQIDSKGNQQISQYWSPNFEKRYHNDNSQLVAQYRDLLRETVSSQMISEVPLGVMLSGGVDSSTIVATMSELGVRDIRTYAMGVSEDDPELQRARIVAKQFNTIHSETIFEPHKLSNFSFIIENLGEPINLLPISYSYTLVEKMKPEITIALSGSGGDEVFGGYDYYREALILQHAARIARYVPKAILNTVAIDPAKATFTKNASPLKKLQILSTLLKLAPAHRKSFIFRQHGDFLSHSLYSEAYKEKVKGIDTGKIIDEWFMRPTDGSYLERVMYADLILGNAPSTVMLGDIAGMANALEMRSPFLSHRLIEFSASLPMNMKVRSVRNRRFNKYIMKKAMEGILPQEILYGKKMGFGYNVRWSSWIRGIWKEKFADIIFKRALPDSNLFSMQYIEKTFRQHLLGTHDHSTVLLGLMIFDLWYERFILHEPPEKINHILSI